MQLNTAADARRFALGGNAHLTLRSRKSGTRYTYRVKASDDGRVRFVGLLTGPNNDADYTYIGVLRDDGFRLTKKSAMPEDAPPVRAMRYFADKVIEGERLPPALEVFHEGRCGRCARRLTVPESIESGFGPECINHV